MKIGELAAASGVSAKMIRHYESLGLLGRAARSEAGYRLYGAADVATLSFVRHARKLGFSLSAIGKLLSLWQDPERSSAEVRRLAGAHLAELEARQRELAAMVDALQVLVRSCHGDQRPSCPILHELASADVPPQAAMPGASKSYRSGA